MPRPPWSSLPEPVVSWAEDVLGGRIVQARSMAGGFSPGTADIVATASGSRAFVKAIGPEPNEHSPSIHRREIVVMDRLPEGLPAPRLLGHFDDGRWVALAFEVVDGAPPATPWTPVQLEATLDACAAVRAVVPQPGLEHVRDELAPVADSWARLRDEGSTAWITPKDIDVLAALAAETHHLDGESLAQLDLRADNVIIRPDGAAVIVDWPWAARGPGWLDALTVLFNVRLYDPAFPVDAVLERHPVFSDMGADAANSVLALLAGFFLRESGQPPQPGVEAVRAFQRAQADAILGWLDERLGLRISP